MSININIPTSENLNNGYEGANYQQDTLAHNGCAPVPAQECNPCAPKCQLLAAKTYSVTPEAAQLVGIPAARNNTLVVFLTNAAALATLAFQLPVYGNCDQGNILIHTQGGVTLFNAINSLGLTGTELADAESILELQWNGVAWQAIAS